MNWRRVMTRLAVYADGIDPDFPVWIAPRDLIEVGEPVNGDSSMVRVCVWTPDGNAVVVRGYMSEIVVYHRRSSSPLTPLEALVLLAGHDTWLHELR